MQHSIKQLLTLAVAFIGLLCWHSCGARSIGVSMSPTYNNVSTKAIPSDAIIDPGSQMNASAPLEHIQNPKTKCPMNLTNIHVIHMPCDIDLPRLSSYIETLPNQCICAYNTRYNSEEEYRNFKILQLEAFFFGQYAERMKRFEIEPHDFPD